MTGKVINKDGNIVLLSNYGELLINSTTEEIKKKLKKRINEETHIWVEYSIRNNNIGDGAFVEKIYTKEFGTTQESVSDVTIRHENKKYPINGFISGFDNVKCTNCKQSFIGDKKSIKCEICAISELLNYAKN